MKSLKHSTTTINYDDQIGSLMFYRKLKTCVTIVFYGEFLNLILEVGYFKVWSGVFLPDAEFSWEGGFQT